MYEQEEREQKERISRERREREREEYENLCRRREPGSRFRQCSVCAKVGEKYQTYFAVLDTAFQINHGAMTSPRACAVRQRTVTSGVGDYKQHSCATQDKYLVRTLRSAKCASLRVQMSRTFSPNIRGYIYGGIGRYIYNRCFTSGVHSKNPKTKWQRRER